MNNNLSNDALYLEAQIGDIDINCLIDTGSTLSVIHPKKYYAIPEKMRPNLSKSTAHLCMADGSEVESLGFADFHLSIDGIFVKQQMVVAKIDAPLILGYDFLHSNNCQLDLGNGGLILQGRQLHCQKESQMPSIFRVFIKDNVVVPAESEIILPCYVDPLCYATKNVLVEPGKSRLLEEGIIIARAVVDLSVDEFPLRVANMNTEPKTLYKGTCAAVCEEIINVNGKGQSCDYSKQQNIEKVRHIKKESDLPEHLQNLWMSCKDQLSEVEHLTVKTFLRRYQSVFAKSKNDLGVTNIIQHQIDTGNARPIKQPPRRLPLAKQKEAENEIHRMLDNNIIEPSNSPWSSPVVLVTKRDGSLRFCIDYRRLNNITYKDSYPLPLIQDSLDKLGGMKWFSTLDLASGYWQVAMDPKDIQKTAFVTSQGLFQFKVMPFGLCNAPATFERLMEHVLAGLHYETCLIYLDDVIIFSSDFDSHVHRLEEVLNCIADAGLKVSAKKCHFFQEEVIFLGHKVSRVGIATDPSKSEAVTKWPTPQTVHDVRSFLGTCSYYRRFIKGFADIARPLHKLTEKLNKFQWTTECEDAFQKLKTKLVSAPILGYPTPDNHYILDTDASNFGIGAVLSQLVDGVETVIAYFSKLFSKSERNYCVTRRELLAVVTSVKHFHHYLYGVNFTVRTDHGALTWLMQFKNPEGQMARWLEVLSTYDFSIHHRPGKLHGNADGLSRRPCSPCGYCSRREQKSNHEEEHCIRVMTRHQTNTAAEQNSTRPESDKWFSRKSLEEIREAQINDPILREVIQLKETRSEKPKWENISHTSSILKTYWSQWDRLILQNGVLYRKWPEDGHRDIIQLVVPISFQKEILHLLHNNIVSGHMGITRTIDRLKQRFYWVNFTDSVEQWCKACIECQKRKGPVKKHRGYMKQYLVGAPLERIAIDILGPLPLSLNNNKYILVLTDYFTRWTECYAMPNQEAATVTKIFVEQFVCRFGIPYQIHTDQGRQFESRLFQEMCSMLQIDKTRTTSFHPQSDGLVERFNRTVEDMLSKFVSINQRDWETYLPLVMMAYRSSVHESTGYSPCLMMFGRDINLPVDLLYGKPPSENETTQIEYIDDTKRIMWEVHEHARENMSKASNRQKRQYDHRSNLSKYKSDDAVWLQVTSRVKGRSPKLQTRWDGPFFVVEALSDLVYKIQKTPNSACKVVHHDRLKPYFGAVEGSGARISEDSNISQQMERQKLQ